MDRLTVLLPAHNEAAIIGDVVAACRRAAPDAQLVVVSDGSRDDTAARARAAGAEVVELRRNVGKGAAIVAALPHVRGEHVVLLDADGQDDPAQIPTLVSALTDDAALVIGSRFLGRFERGAIAPIDRLGTRALNTAFRLAFGQPITDTQAGFRALRTATLRDLPLRARGYDFETDVLCQVARRGGRIVEVPVARRPRLAGRSDLRRVRDGLKILGRMARARVSRDHGR